MRDAATLVIVDESASVPRILVGRRAKGHVFMAGKLVFPGGRLDPSDLRLAQGFDLAPDAMARLSAGVRATFTPRRAVALALAAIRETWEETGIMIGTPQAGFASASLPVWSDFTASEITPDPRRLIPFARAVTPPRQIRRFDTRFFAVSAQAIGHQVPLKERPTDEFDHVAWMTIAELEEQALAPITRQIVSDLSERLSAGDLFDASRPMACYRRRNERFRREVL